jgi:hypothetical protein
VEAKAREDAGKGLHLPRPPVPKMNSKTASDFASARIGTT